MKRKLASTAISLVASMGKIKPATSYGVLVYRKEGTEIEFLLGLNTQRSGWTVFKGMPEAGESPCQTAEREFVEETTLSLKLDEPPELVLHGSVGNKKRLEIFLHEGTDLDASQFDIDKVCTIDKEGPWFGQPEIVEIQWKTLSQALEGKMPVFKSQRSILLEAHDHLESKYSNIRDV